MWLERFLIIVPSLAHKQLPYSWGTYAPRPVEITIMAATFAAMVLLYALFAKFVPIISIWELKAGELPAPQGHGTPAHSAVKMRAGGRRMSAIYGLYSDPSVAQRRSTTCARPA